MQTIFLTKLTKQGTSLGVIIPVNILNALHWERGDILVFGFSGVDQIFLKRITDLELEKLKPQIIT